MKKIPFLNISLSIFVLAIIIVAGFYLWQNIRQRLPDRILVSQEINNYQGEDLSSVNDFRENSIKGPQYIDKEKYRLTVAGLIDNPQELSYDDTLAQFPSYKKVITLNCVEGWSAKILWEGIRLRDLIALVQPQPAAKTIIFYAVDGYSTSFPLEYFYNNDILLAHKMNGVTLPPERGFPFQLVAENKWGYKWVKWIDRIEFSSDTDYQGYWELRGYSSDGNLDEDFLK